MNKTFIQFDGGTKRAGEKPPVWLCPLELIEAVSETRLHGDRKYEPGNWQQGGRKFFVDCLGHAIEHLWAVAFPEYDDGDGLSVEQHIGHAACNLAFILWGLKRDRVSPGDWANVALLEYAPAAAETSEAALPNEQNDGPTQDSDGTNFERLRNWVIQFYGAGGLKG